jgi:hypothetical protein
LPADVRIADPYGLNFQRDRIKFDNQRQLLVGYRDAKDPEEPAVTWANAKDGAAGQIRPLNDFPGAKGLDIWDAAASNGRVLLAGVLLRGGERDRHEVPRHVLLTYDVDGTLRSLWEMNPYHHHRIAVDDAGYVYALGHRLNGPTPNFIIKYSPEGVVEREFLSSQLVSGGNGVVITDGRSGPNLLWIDGKRLFVYLARPQDLLEFDLDGSLQRRTPLATTLARLAKEHNAPYASLTNAISEGAGASMLAEVLAIGKKHVLARFSRDGSRATLIEPEEPELGTTFKPLIGMKGNALIFLNRYTGTFLQR